MINQQLVDYIKQQTQAGVSKDAVRKALGDAGWPPADVDDSLKAAEPASAAASMGPSAQGAINPAVAMGGVDVTPKEATMNSSTDKFFAKPAASSISKMTSEEEHPSAKKFIIAMIVMGAVIVLLAGALAFVYFNLNSQLDNAQTGSADSSQSISLQQQINQLITDKEGLTAQIQSLNADNQDILTELSMFVPTGSGGASSTPLSATVKGTLTGTASTTFALITARNVKIIVANSKDAKVAAALTPLIESTSTVTLAGTHPGASLNLTVTSVNGTPL